jgi:hypothetical protein
VSTNVDPIAEERWRNQQEAAYFERTAREYSEREEREAALNRAYADGRADEREAHKALRDAVEQILEDGHMNQENLAWLRAAWEAT